MVTPPEAITLATTAAAGTWWAVRPVTRTPNGMDPYTDPDYRRLAPTIRNRPCRCCHNPAPNQADHLRYPTVGPLTLRDLQALCPRCHNRKTRRAGRFPWKFAPLPWAHLPTLVAWTPIRCIRRSIRAAHRGLS